MRELLRRVDLCFVVDTTGSMGSFIREAQRRLLETLSALRAQEGLDLQAGLVEYRDHPPQDKSFVTRAFPLGSEFGALQRAINAMKAEGGGDGPEAVFDGVKAACDEMKWRPHSLRFALLVGDAPPHGVGAPGDGFPKGCPCRLDTAAVTALAEERRVTIFGLAMGAGPVASFTEIARGTGGRLVPASNAEEVVKKMVEILGAELRELSFDAEVLEAGLASGSLDAEELSGRLSRPRLAVAKAVARLGKRGFWDGLGEERAA